MRPRRLSWMASLVGLLLAAPLDASAFDLVRYEEATIADIHAAFKAKTLTCRMLVQMYLDRIEAWAAGAIMLAKSNMAEFAFDPMETVNSLLPGYTRNPYALDRVTAGSSGGTAAAVAANFGTVGLGTRQQQPAALPTGFPAITVPMGFVRDSLPVGLQVLDRAWSEPTLITIVYAYEQETRHRRPPASTPPLPARP